MYWKYLEVTNLVVAEESKETTPLLDSSSSDCAQDRLLFCRSWQTEMRNVESKWDSWVFGEDCNDVCEVDLKNWNFGNWYIKTLIFFYLVWMDCVEPLTDTVSWLLRSSNGMSGGWVKPDLYLSTTREVSWKRDGKREQRGTHFKVS